MLLLLIFIPLYELHENDFSTLEFFQEEAETANQSLVIIKGAPKQAHLQLLSATHFLAKLMNDFVPKSFSNGYESFPIILPHQVDWRAIIPQGSTMNGNHKLVKTTPVQAGVSRRYADAPAPVPVAVAAAPTKSMADSKNRIMYLTIHVRKRAKIWEVHMGVSQFMGVPPVIIQNSSFTGINKPFWGGPRGRE